MGKRPHHKKDELLDSLPSDFYKLLEMMTIARSRKHITNYYGNNGVGKFPEKIVQLHLIVILTQKVSY